MLDEFEYINDDSSEDTQHISCSQLDMFRKCPRKWYYAYVEKIKSPSSLSMVRGGSYHKALEYNFRQKIESGIDLPCKDMLDIFSEDYNKKLNSEEISFNPKMTPGECKDGGIGCVKAYYTSEYMSAVQPIAVEERITKYLPEIGVDLVGVIDIIKDDGNIIDHKTSGKKWQANKVLNDMQSTTYGILLGKDEFTCDFHVAVAIKKPYIDCFTVKRKKSHMDWWLKNIQGIVMCMESMKSGMVLTSTPEGFWCDPRYCGYYNICMPK